MLIGISIACLIMGALLVVPCVKAMYREMDLNELKPTAWLIYDLESSRNNLLAWTELLERKKSNKLNPSEIDRIIDAALAGHIRAGIGAGNPYDFLGQQFLAGKMNPQQKEKFFGQMISISLEVRKSVRVGDRMPLRVRTYTVQPSAWAIRATPTTATVDEHDTPFDLDASGQFSRKSQTFVSGSVAPAQDQGKHKLELTWKIEVFRGDHFNAGNVLPENLVFQMNIVRSSDFVTVAPDSSEPVALEVDPQLESQMRKAIRVQALGFDKTRGALIASVYISSTVPQDVAFDVYARANGHEVKMGSLSSRAPGAGKSSVLFAPLDDCPPTVDFILRSSQTAARETVDIDKIWVGDLTYLNIPVRVLESTTKSAVP